MALNKGFSCGQTRGPNAYFSKQLCVYATANKWKSNQKGMFFHFMLSESSLQVGSNELERNKFTAHGLDASSAGRIARKITKILESLVTSVSRKNVGNLECNKF